MKPTTTIMLFRYFNSKGRVIDEITVIDDEAADSGQGEASPSGTTSAADAACAVQALIIKVTSERLSLHDARAIRSVGANGQKPVSVAEALSELETMYGASSLQWARAIFTHLKLRPPTVQ